MSVVCVPSSINTSSPTAAGHQCGEQGWQASGFGWHPETQNPEKTQLFWRRVLGSLWITKVVLMSGRSSSKRTRSSSPPKESNKKIKKDKRTTLSTVWSFFNNKIADVHKEAFANCMHCGENVSFARKNERVITHLKKCKPFDAYLNQ
jgi:hypothetical protein